MDKTLYDKLIPYKPTIELFNKTGSYVGGGDGIFEAMGVIDRSCPSCLGKALINAYNFIKEYEKNT